MVLLEQIVVDKLKTKAYAVDLDREEYFVYYKDVRYVLGQCFHIPKFMQTKVINELKCNGYIEIVDKSNIKISE